jgi:hypothetical protein
MAMAVSSQLPLGLPPLPTPPPAAPAKPDRLSTPALKAHGWTDAGVRRFLGSPDATKPNPYSRRLPPVRLYDLARVEQVERTPEWQVWRQQSERRRQGATRASETRRHSTLAEVDALEIRLPDLERGELEREATAHRNALAWERAQWRDYDELPEDATPEDATPAALARWCVNWLRHQATAYDETLAALFGRTGRDEAARRLRARVYGEIARAYPWLAEEAWRQRQAREWTP